MKKIIDFIRISESLEVRDFKNVIREIVPLVNTKVSLLSDMTKSETIDPNYGNPNLILPKIEEKIPKGSQGILWEGVMGHPGIYIFDSINWMQEYDEEKYYRVEHELLFFRQDYEPSLGIMDGKFTVFYPSASRIIAVPLSNEVFEDLGIADISDTVPYDMVFLVDRKNPFKDNVLCRITLNYKDTQPFEVTVILPFNYRYLTHPLMMENVLYYRQIIHSYRRKSFFKESYFDAWMRKNGLLTDSCLISKGFEYDSETMTYYNSKGVRISYALGGNKYVVLSDGVTKTPFPKPEDGWEKCCYLWYEKELDRLLKAGYMRITNMNHEDTIESIRELNKDRKMFSDKKK